MQIKSDTNTPVTVDNASGEPLHTPIVKRQKRIDLSAIDDIRLEMARTYRRMESGEIETSDGTKLAYVLAQIGKLIEIHEIEKRIEILELTLKQRNTK